MRRGSDLLAEVMPGDDGDLRPLLHPLPDFDLGELASRGVEPPRLICSGMLYSGGVHCVAGQPGGGKTTLAAWWMLQHIRDGGAVMLLDEESGPEVMAEKFPVAVDAPQDSEGYLNRLHLLLFCTSRSLRPNHQLV